MNLDLPKPPPSKCRCTHLRIQHRGGRWCQHCNCDTYQHQPHEPEPSKQDRDAEILRRHLAGETRLDIASWLGCSLTPIDRVIRAHRAQQQEGGTAA